MQYSVSNRKLLELNRFYLQHGEVYQVSNKNYYAIKLLPKSAQAYKNSLVLLVDNPKRIKTILVTNLASLINPKSKKLPFVKIQLKKSLTVDKLIALIVKLAHRNQKVNISSLQKTLSESDTKTDSEDNPNILVRIYRFVKNTLQVVNEFIDVILGIIALFSIYRYFKALKESQETARDVVLIAVKEKQYYLQIKDKVDLRDYGKLFYALDSMVSSKHLNGVLIYGPPGIGKTFAVKYWLNLHDGIIYQYYKGAAKSIDTLYAILFQNRFANTVIVFDDFDSIVKKANKDSELQDVVNLLKAALETTEERLITYPHSELKSDFGRKLSASIPEKFIFRAKIVIITNLQREEIDKAIFTRVYPVEIKFDNKQMHQVIKRNLAALAENIPEKEAIKVLEYCTKIAEKCKVPLNFRLVKAALDAYKIYGDNQWRQVVKEIYCAS